MMFRPLILCLVFINYLGPCQGDELEFTNFIGGPGITNAGLGMIPSYVVISLNQTELCGGVLLNANHILTAGSCVLNEARELRSANSLQARVGIINLPSTESFVVGRIYVHPLFNPWTFENDIAVLRLESSIALSNQPDQNVAAAQISDRIISHGTGCVLPGFANATTTPPTSILVLMDTRILSNTACNVAQIHRIRVLDSQLCAIGRGNSTGACSRNRGSGLYCDNEVVGILSNQFSCGDFPSTPGIYTQIRRYQSWIAQQFLRSDIPLAGVTPNPTFPGGSSAKKLAETLIVLNLVLFVFKFL